MIKNILAQHKHERDSFLQKEYVPRERVKEMKKQLKSPLIKVIKGPRRSGKSVSAFILLKSENFAYVNFDDDKLLGVDTDDLIKGIFSIYKNPNFFLFDEIQNVNNWELFINKLHRRGYNLILTGSNSRLLSQELSTALTGRHIAFELLPFNFIEFLKAKDISIKEPLIPETKGIVLQETDEFMKNGGFPEITTTPNINIKAYLDALFDAVLLKDVIKRKKVRFPQKLYELASYFITNCGVHTSFTKLKNSLQFNSVNTLEAYATHLEESYLFFLLNRFSYKMKEQLKAQKKLYLVDTGFVQAKSFQFSPNIGRLMENVVFIELVKRGFRPNQELFYYMTRNGKEVDFIIKEGNSISQLLQVWNADEQSNADSKKREFSALIEAKKELNCDKLAAITWDKEGEETCNGAKISYIPLWKWMMSLSSRGGY